MRLLWGNVTHGFVPSWFGLVNSTLLDSPYACNPLFSGCQVASKIKSGRQFLRFTRIIFLLISGSNLTNPPYEKYP